MLSAIALPLVLVTGTMGRTPAARVREYEAAYVSGYAETPSFARQTGLACNVCHTHYPELTATGRAFKLNGYVFRRADSLQGRRPAKSVAQPRHAVVVHAADLLHRHEESPTGNAERCRVLPRPAEPVHRRRSDAARRGIPAGHVRPAERIARSRQRRFPLCQ